jgi:hypothetical protein
MYPAHHSHAVINLAKQAVLHYGNMKMDVKVAHIVPKKGQLQVVPTAANQQTAQDSCLTDELLFHTAGN